MILLLKAAPARRYITEQDARDAARARHGTPPAEGDRIEFASDRHTDKGPASGTVAGVKATVDGYYVTVKFADAQQSFSWDDIRDGATKSGDRWMIKARPTPAQAAAGNYKKPRRQWNGLEIAIENPVGSIREGKGWRTKMANAYGYICRTEAVDGDEVDVYLGPELDTAPTVYVVHQRRAGDWKNYDEDKAMLGFLSEAAARAAYLKHYDDTRFLGPITAMPVDEFVRKVRATADKPAMIKSYQNWHGHVRPRPDGMKARCGGPRSCHVCQDEMADQPLTKTVLFLRRPAPLS